MNGIGQKKIGILFLGVFILGIGIAFFVLRTRKIETLNPPVSSKLSLLVTPIRSDVSLGVNQSGQEIVLYQSPIVEKTSVKNGTWIKTSDTGRAIVEGDFRAVVDQSSEISVNIPERNKSKIILASGQVWSRIEKVFDQGEYHGIETRNAVASVRGTSFGLSFLNDTTILLVASGTVAFTPIGGWTSGNQPILSENQTVLVNAGHKAVRKFQGNIQVSALTNTDLDTEWFKLNNQDYSTPKPQSKSFPPIPKPTVTTATSSDNSAMPPENIRGESPESTTTSTPPDAEKTPPEEKSPTENLYYQSDYMR